jgi:hypothetical protein
LHGKSFSHEANRGNKFYKPREKKNATIYVATKGKKKKETNIK